MELTGLQIVLDADGAINAQNRLRSESKRMGDAMVEDANRAGKAHDEMGNKIRGAGRASEEAAAKHNAFVSSMMKAAGILARIATATLLWTAGMRSLMLPLIAVSALLGPLGSIVVLLGVAFVLFGSKLAGVGVHAANLVRTVGTHLVNAFGGGATALGRVNVLAGLVQQGFSRLATGSVTLRGGFAAASGAMASLAGHAVSFVFSWRGIVTILALATAGMAAFTVASLAMIVATGGIIAAFAGVAIAIKGVFSGFKTAMDREMIQVAFRGMIGNAKLADATLKNLFKFADTTPFDVDPVLKYGQALLGAGVTAQNLVDTLSKLGNISEGTPQKMESAINAYSKAKAKGFAQTDTLNLFTENGVQIMEMLRDSTGKTTAELYQMAEQSKLSFAVIDTAIDLAVSKGHRWFNLMADGSLTMKGLVSTLRSDFANLGDAFAAPIMRSLKPAVGAVSDALKAALPYATMGGEFIGRQITLITGLLKTGTLGAYLKLSFTTALSSVWDWFTGLFSALSGYLHKYLLDPLSEASVFAALSTVGSNIGTQILYFVDLAGVKLRASLSYSIQELGNMLASVPMLGSGIQTTNFSYAQLEAQQANLSQIEAERDAKLAASNTNFTNALADTSGAVHEATGTFGALKGSAVELVTAFKELFSAVKKPAASSTAPQSRATAPTSSANRSNVTGSRAGDLGANYGSMIGARAAEVFGGALPEADPIPGLNTPVPDAAPTVTTYASGRTSPALDGLDDIGPTGRANPASPGIAYGGGDAVDLIPGYSLADVTAASKTAATDQAEKDRLYNEAMAKGREGQEVPAHDRPLKAVPVKPPWEAPQNFASDSKTMVEYRGNLEALRLAYHAYIDTQGRAGIGAQEFGRRMEELKQKAADSLIDPKAYSEALGEWRTFQAEKIRLAEEAQRRIQTGAADFGESFSAGLKKWGEEQGNSSQQAFKLAGDALDSFSSNASSAFSSMIDGSKTASQAFKDFAVSLLRDIANMIIKLLILKAVQALVGMYGGGAIGATSSVPATVAHSGGVIGSSAGSRRAVDSSLFAGAPRLHSGLGSDEYPAILQRGETVIPAGARANPNGGGNVNQNATANVTINYHAGDKSGEAETTAGQDGQNAKLLVKLVDVRVNQAMQDYQRQSLGGSGARKR